MGIVGVFPLHAFYPLMKRWTWWPQAWLGEVFPGDLGLLVDQTDSQRRPCVQLGHPCSMDIRYRHDAPARDLDPFLGRRLVCNDPFFIFYSITPD